MTEAERAYAAGIMDGEGCFTVLRRHERTNKGQAVHRAWYVAAVNVTNTERAMLEWMQVRWGGSIYGKASLSPRSGLPGKKCWHWSLTAKALEPFLEDVQPYLVVKYQQCRLLRMLRAVTYNCGQAQTEQQHRARAALTALHERIYLKSQALKRAA